MTRTRKLNVTETTEIDTHLEYDYPIKRIAKIEYFLAV